MSKYITTEPLDNCQYYLAFIHEASYDSSSINTWLSKEQIAWANGRVTELKGFYQDDETILSWEVIPHRDNT